MTTVIEVVIGALEPYVGRTVADTCVRATALAAGKFSDGLSGEDLPAIEDNIRRLLAPIAPAVTVDSILASIREGVGAV